MTFSKKTAAILIGLLASTPVLAEEPGFTCKIISSGTGGFLPPVMYVQVDPKAGNAVIFDAAIKETFGKPIVVEATEISAQKYRLKYKAILQSSNSGKLNISYTVRFDQGRKHYTIQGFLSGYDNNVTGSGRCEVSE